MSADSPVKARYLAACHALQTGVALEHARGSQDGTPKHLRVGINVAHCDHAGLVQLLVRKGILTEAEYLEAIADQLGIEVEKYERNLGVRLV